MNSFYEVPAPLTSNPTAHELNEFAKSAKLFQKTRYGALATLKFIRRVGEASSEHIAWKCDLEFPSGIVEMVCKFKANNGKLCFLSERHVQTMKECFKTVASTTIPNLRVAEYVICEIPTTSDVYYLWFEEFLPNFQKFLKYPNAFETSKKLAVSFSKRVRALQSKMLKSGKSPLIDAQGAIVEGCLVLSDIETADTLSRFSDISADECVKHIKISLQEDDHGGLLWGIGFTVVAVIASTLLFSLE